MIGVAAKVQPQDLADLLQYATDMITVTDIGGTCTFASPATMSLMGMRPEDVVGLTSHDLIHPDDLERVTDTAARQLLGELEPAPIQYRQLHADGRYRHIEAHVSALPPDHPLGVVVINSRDVSARVEAEQARAESQAVVAMVAEGSDLASILDAVAGLVHRRAPNATLTITCADQCVGDSTSGGGPGHEAAEARPRSAATCSRAGDRFPGGGAREPVGHVRIERTITALDGGPLGRLALVCPARSTGAVAPLLDEAEDLLSIVLERCRAEADLAHRATHDPLTDLPNRALLHDRMHQALNRLRRDLAEPVATLFLDLDGFKSINDTLGHDIGDEVLREAAERLRDAVRQVDTVARLGGDEFVVLAETDQPDALALRLNAAMRAPFRSSRGNSLSCSIGIAIATRDDTPSSLLDRADDAMYEVKANGRDGYLLRPSA